MTISRTTAVAEPAENEIKPDGAGVSLVWQLLLLAAASFFSPLIVWANSPERASILGYLAIGATVSVVSVLLRWAFVGLGLDGLGSTYSLTLAVLGWMNLGLALGSGIPRWMLAAGTVILGWIGYRLRTFTPFRLAMTWLVIFLAAYPVVLYFNARTDEGEPTLDEPPPLTAPLESPHRDLVVIVLDAYGNSEVLRDLYGFDSSGFATDLEAHGFSFETDTVANYGRTRFSVTSLLDLDYPVTSGGLTGADLDHLLDSLGGESRLFDWLESQGYRLTYVESGWFGTKCGESTDTCVPGSWPDESFYDVTYRSLLRDLPGFETGRSFSLGAQKVMDWLTTDLEALLTNDDPDVVYAHVLAPHPPLFLQGDCRMDAQAGFKGFTIYQPGMDEAALAEARTAYVAQVTCVNTMLEKIATMADEQDAMVVMFGDHGPDSYGQLFVSGADWNQDQRRERFSSFVATRVPGCDMSNPLGLVNVGRRLVSCLSDNVLPDLPVSTYEGAPSSDGEMIVEVPAPDFGGGE